MVLVSCLPIPTENDKYNWSVDFIQGPTKFFECTIICGLLWLEAFQIE